MSCPFVTDHISMKGFVNLVMVICASWTGQYLGQEVGWGRKVDRQTREKAKQLNSVSTIRFHNTSDESANVIQNRNTQRSLNKISFI